MWIAAHACHEVVPFDGGDGPVLSDWLARRRPLIARRGDIREQASLDGVALGLPLPPDQGKRRIILRASPTSIARVSPPPCLMEVLPAMPRHWSEPLRDLLRQADSLQVELRVYGSAAWQWLTGLAYLTWCSDIDLLWRPASVEQLQRTIAMLLAWEAATLMRADGEVLFGQDRAVSWREWALSRTDSLLAKGMHSAQLCTRAQLVPCESSAAQCT